MSKIKESRINLGITQRQLAELLGIPIRTIESWETGERKPPAYVENLIVDKLKTLKKEQE